MSPGQGGLNLVHYRLDFRVLIHPEGGSRFADLQGERRIVWKPGQCGRPSPLGFPVAANRVQYPIICSDNAASTGSQGRQARFWVPNTYQSSAE